MILALSREGRSFAAGSFGRSICVNERLVFLCCSYLLLFAIDDRVIKLHQALSNFEAV